MDDIFYLVPLTDSSTYINNIRLCDLCINNEINQKNKIKKIFLNIYNSSELPEYLIVIQNDNRIRELLTDLDISTDDYCDLQKYRVFESETLLHYYIQSNYKNKIINLVTNSKLKKEKGLIKKISMY